MPQRAPLRETAEVQAGWREIFNLIINAIPGSIMLRYQTICQKAVFTSRRQKDDPKCVGCRELETMSKWHSCEYAVMSVKDIKMCKCGKLHPDKRELKTALD